MGEAIHSNLTDRPSIVFQRCQVKGITPIRGIIENTVESVVGYDANALYLWCAARSMLTGRPCVYRHNLESGQLELAYEPDISGKQNAWLAELVCKFSDLRYAIKNSEQHIGPKKLKVDRYCPKTNTAFEFDG